MSDSSEALTDRSPYNHNTVETSAWSASTSPATATRYSSCILLQIQQAIRTGSESKGQQCFMMERLNHGINACNQHLSSPWQVWYPNGFLFPAPRTTNLSRLEIDRSKLKTIRRQVTKLVFAPRRIRTKRWPWVAVQSLRASHAPVHSRS